MFSFPMLHRFATLAPVQRVLGRPGPVVFQRFLDLQHAAPVQLVPGRPGPLLFCLCFVASPLEVVDLPSSARGGGFALQAAPSDVDRF